MSKFRVGDVVMTDFVFEDDPTKKKEHPGLILKIYKELDGNVFYSIAYITSVNGSARNIGKWILEGSKECKSMRLHDSFINLQRIISVKEYAIRSFRGICPAPLLDEIFLICKNKSLPY